MPQKKSIGRLFLGTTKLPAPPTPGCRGHMSSTCKESVPSLRSLLRAACSSSSHSEAPPSYAHSPWLVKPDPASKRDAENASWFGTWFIVGRNGWLWQIYWIPWECFTIKASCDICGGINRAGWYRWEEITNSYAGYFNPVWEKADNSCEKSMCECETWTMVKMFFSVLTIIWWLFASSLCCLKQAKVPDWGHVKYEIWPVTSVIGSKGWHATVSWLLM